MDKLMLGLSTAVIGILVVFFGLIILIACIYAMTAITGRSKKAPAPTQEQTPAREAAAEINVDPAQDEQLVAVITAAIAAVWQGEENSGFVVRRIKRFDNSTPRARAAREEQIFSRLI